MAKYEQVITKTPLRVSFLGGGTDINTFYKKFGGSIFSSAIDKFVYVTVKKHSKFYKKKYRLNYSSSENVNSRDKIKNKIIQQCLKITKIDFPLYISTVSDIPAGSGLGGSSAFVVGLLKSLNLLVGNNISQKKLYDQAKQVEASINKKIVGIQDLFPGCFGGVNFYKINKNGSIKILKINKKKIYQNFNKKIKLYWTGETRMATKIIRPNNYNKTVNQEYLKKIMKLSDHYYYIYLKKNNFNLNSLSLILSKSWNFKKKISNSINTRASKKIIDFSKKTGALGSKLCGAGGGGFVLIIGSKNLFKKLDNKFGKKNSVDIELYKFASEVIYKL